MAMINPPLQRFHTPQAYFILRSNISLTQRVNFIAKSLNCPADNSGFYMAGTAGFEPADAGVKVPCLTAWLRPNIKKVCLLKYAKRKALRKLQFNGVADGIRTHDLQGHNLAL